MFERTYGLGHLSLNQFIRKWNNHLGLRNVLEETNNFIKANNSHTFVEKHVKHLQIIILHLQNSDLYKTFHCYLFIYLAIIQDSTLFRL